MYSESDLLMLSAVQHLAFCERQCCLIHIEQAWAENRLTAEGRILHDHVHSETAESRAVVYIVRGLKLRSFALGLSGVADVVEFHRAKEGGVALPGKRGMWKPFPVEYKRGKPKSDRCDEVQLCGQAICIEEMLGCPVNAGALYYGSQHKRYEVAFDQVLRDETTETCRRLHELIGKRATPPAKYEKKCEKCSMMDICVPKMQNRKVEKYLESIVHS